jgi:SUR7/PalI family
MDTVTACSKPTPMYVFDLTEIFSSELFAGQSVTVPTPIQDDLHKLHVASHWMFAMYMVAVILLFITVLVGLTALCTRFGSVITTIVSFLAFLFITASTFVAQIMFIIYRNVINDQITVFNVSASLGTAMFAFSWTASVCALIATVLFMFGICCGTGATRYDKGYTRRGVKV